MVLVEVHRELVLVGIGAKDMAEKNKNQWKMIKLMQQLEKTQHRIPELQSDTSTDGAGSYPNLPYTRDIDAIGGS